MKNRKIQTASELRGVLLATIEAVIEGRVNVAQANSVAQLSGEFHKSIRQEWDMRVYAHEHMTIDQGKIVKLLDGDSDGS